MGSMKKMPPARALPQAIARFEPGFPTLNLSGVGNGIIQAAAD